MQPAATSFGSDSVELVTNHLSELLGEGLFPVSTRRSPDAEQPHMLALDVVGQPVVIEVVAELDADALIQALAYAGQAGRFTSSDLARLYQGGAEQFGVDIMAFRESLPAAYSRRGLRVGARLLLVCSSVSPEIADALEFLRAPGRQVEVLQMGVIHGAGGRRYLDVSPLAGPIAEMRQVEQANLRLVRSKEAFAAAMAYDEQRKGFARFAVAPDGAPEAVSPFAATGTEGSPSREMSVTSPVSGVMPTAGSAAAPTSTPIASPAAPAARFSPPTPRTAPTAPAARPGPSTPVAAPHAADATAAHSDPSATPAAPPPRTSAFAPPPSAAEHTAGSQYTPVYVPAPGGPLIPPDSRALTDDDDDDVDDAPGFAASAPPVAPHVPPATDPHPPTGPGRRSVGDPSRRTASNAPLGPPMALSTGAHPLGSHATSSHHANAGADPARNQRAHPGLEMIGRSEGPFELVWLRERRGQRLTATLRSDGLIELPTGEVFGDPDDAARIVSHAALGVDGWGVWRLGDGGPTLRQAIAD